MTRHVQKPKAHHAVDEQVLPIVQEADGDGDKLQGGEVLEAQNEDVHELPIEGDHAGDSGDGGVSAGAKASTGHGRVAKPAAHVHIRFGDPRLPASTATPSIPSTPTSTATASGRADDVSPIGLSGIVWRNERRSIGDMVEWEKNPRILTAEQSRQIRESITKFGFADPVILNQDGMIIGGHMRRRVMLANCIVNPTTTIDVRIPSRQLTPEEAEELAIRLNKNTGEWDFDRLANEFDTIKLIEWGFEPQEFGIEDPRLGLAHPEESAEPIEVFDENVRVRVGDIWEIGENGSRVICGDSADPATVTAIMGHDPIDFVFTSPPYNVSIGCSKHDDTPMDDYLAFLRKIVSAFMPHLADGRCIGWNISSFIKTSPHKQFCMLEECGLQYRRLLIWKKVGIPLPNFQHTRNNPVARRLTPHYQYEFVGLFSKGELQYGAPVEFDETLQYDVFEIMQTLATSDIPTEENGKRRHGGLTRHSLKVHPAAFPTRLPGSFIQHMADVGAIVFDPFVGSGTTLLAAEALGRVGVGCEIDPRYVEVLLRRAERLELMVVKR